MVNRTFRKAGFVGVTALLLFGSMTAMAQNGCERRIHNADMQLQQAVRRHGIHSHQAESKRRELERARASCHR